MHPNPQCAFTAPFPSCFFSTSFIPVSKCSRRGQLPKSRPPSPRRVLPEARIRRGATPEPVIRETLFDVEPMKDVDFNLVDFAKFKGKVVFAVNVASEDQYTDPVYTFLATLLDKYHDDGFEVLAFPCNWFGQKETKSHEEIKAFVHSKYSDKITVMANADPEWNEVFALGQAHFPGEIIWNFHGKFLFDRKGKPVERFDLLSEDTYVETAVYRVLAGTPKTDITESAPPPDQVNVVNADSDVGLQPAVADDGKSSDGKDDEEDEDAGEAKALGAEEGLAVEAQ